MPVKFVSNERQALEIMHEVDARILDAAAVQILGQAVVNLNQMNAIDTGFLINSGYISTPSTRSYNNTQPTGQYRSDKTGQQVARQRAPEIDIPADAGAVVAFGADYAIYVESRQSFLYKAAFEVQQQIEGAIEQIKRDLGVG